MAPSLSQGSGRLEAPPSNPFYSSTSLSSSTSDLSFPILSPRTLYAQTFDRPSSARSLPSTHYRKNMKDFTGFGTTEDEFEALPLAVRRKYFSTLERLRFAQNSRVNALDELPVQKTRKGSLADRRGLNIPVLEPRRKSSRRLRKLAKKQSVSSSEASWFLTLPEKIKKQQFTREEQVILAGRLRESVILDAADEAIYKASRRPNRQVIDPPTPAASTPRSSTSSRKSKGTTDMTDAMYESFRWMDEESDLDLRLVLDDYHANLDGVVIPTPTSTRRPSFRRQMSISKMPFGRSSLSSLQPRSSPKTGSPNNHNRQKSRARALSLIQPKHVTNNSVSSIDPNATHYQDPEARLKLRVYLASPQKFDEAIEFGFPSLDGVTDGADKENKPPKRTSKEQSSRGLSSRDTPGIKSSFATDGGKSFLDDTVSLFEDDISMADPESPITPLGADTGYRPSRTSTSAYGPRSNKTSADYSHLGITRPTVVKPQDGYTQAMAGSREMTLRMTLTRPDLRADETTIYGWQTTKGSLRESSPVIEEDMEEKIEARGPFGGIDGWGPEKENGVVKRFWNRVRSRP